MQIINNWLLPTILWGCQSPNQDATELTSNCQPKTEIPYDGIDQDCDGYDLTDQDGDGHDDLSVGGDDCDDSDPFIYPGAIESCGDNIDQNCDGDVGGDNRLANEMLLKDADTSFYGEPDSLTGDKIGNIGDHNGDGRDDIAIYSRGEHDGQGNYGRLFLHYNYNEGDNYITDADATLLFKFDSYATNFASFTNVGDINEDGYDDLAVGDHTNSAVATEAGKTYIHLGPLSGTKWIYEQPYATLTGEYEYDHASEALAGVGDVDGDGSPDLLVGAHNFTETGYHQGKVYLIYGPLSGNINLSSAPVGFLGESGEDEAGRVVSSAGDQNGDGLADILIASADYPSPSENRGIVYLYNGPVADGIHDLALADAKLEGVYNDDTAGSSLATAGDVNNDGYDDFLVGADEYPVNPAVNIGKAYVVYGPVSGLQSLANSGAILTGEDQNVLGHTVASAGDVNGDNYDDVLIGMLGNNGYAYLMYGPVFGNFSPWTEADAAFGNDQGSHSGFGVTSADLNSDGYSDVLVSDPYDTANGHNAGVVALFYGGCL